MPALSKTITPEAEGNARRGFQMCRPPGAPYDGSTASARSVRMANGTLLPVPSSLFPRNTGPTGVAANAVAIGLDWDDTISTGPTIAPVVATCATCTSPGLFATTNSESSASAAIR